jgi:hypothetical protein
MNNSLLKENYINNYNFREFGEKGIILEYLGQLVFILGSGDDLHDDFLDRLFDSLERDKSVIPELKSIYPS